MQVHKILPPSRASFTEHNNVHSRLDVFAINFTGFIWDAASLIELPPLNKCALSSRLMQHYFPLSLSFILLFFDSGFLNKSIIIALIQFNSQWFLTKLHLPKSRSKTNFQIHVIYACLHKDRLGRLIDALKIQGWR